MMILIEIIVWFVVILLTVLLVTAVRKIAVQYARRTVAGDIKSVAGGARDYIPLKLNAAGVMPIIFAQAIMFLPVALARKFPALSELQDMNGLWYNVLFAVLIIVFSYFYTAITVRTDEMAQGLKRSGGFIPGIRPGSDTADRLDSVLSRITFPGSLFLAALSILPAIIVQFGVQQSWAMFYGGTSLIIMVGVAIDTIQQINSYLLNSHYDGLMKTGTSNRKALK